MDEKKRNTRILVSVIVLLLIVGATVTILVVKKPFKSKGDETSERKVIQLDVPGAVQTSEQPDQQDANAEIVDSTKDKVADNNKEKNSEKVTTTNNNKPKVIEEKASEKKSEETPMIIIEDPNSNPAPSGGQTKPPANPPKSDEVIELPFVPYSELKQN